MNPPASRAKSCPTPRDSFARRCCRSGLTPSRRRSRDSSPFEQRAIQLTIGQAVTLRIELKPAGVAESVTVRAPISADTPSVETTRAQMSSTVSEVSVANLPVNGRNFIDFALLTPGVTRDVRTGDISFAGQRGTLNSLVVDGADTNNTFFGQTLGRTGSGRAPYQFSQDAVQEFQVNSNAYSAEYGRAGGAVINVVTKSGTNTPHGTIFDFYRDKALNANDAINVLNNRAEVAVSLQPVRRQLRRADPEVQALHLRQLRRPAEHAAERRVHHAARRARRSTPTATAGLAKVTALGQSYTRGQDQDVFLVKTDSQLTARPAADAPLQPPELHRQELRERRAAERARAHRQLRGADAHAQRVVHELRRQHDAQRSPRPVGARPGAGAGEQREPRSDRPPGRLDRPDHRPQQLQPARDDDHARTDRRHADLVPRRALRPDGRRLQLRPDPELLPGQLHRLVPVQQPVVVPAGPAERRGRALPAGVCRHRHDGRDDASRHQRVRPLRAGRVAGE